MKNIEINILLDEVSQKISFEKIDQMAKGNSVFRKLYCYCNKGILRGANDIENFARDFITTYHPDYYKKTFKLILELGTVKLIQVANK